MIFFFLFFLGVGSGTLCEFSPKEIICMRRCRGPVPSQLVLKSIRTQVNSFSFWSISYSSIWSIRTHLVNSYSLFGQFVHILVNLSSFWSTRTHVFGQFVLILGPLFRDICIVEC